MSDQPQSQVLTFEFPEHLFVPDFIPYIEAPQAVQLFTGTASAAKSHFLYQRAIMFALGKEYFRMAFSRKVKETIRDSIFLGFKDIINEWELKRYFHIREHEMDIVCKINGNMLLSAGLDDPEKLKSIKDISHWLVDEMTETEQGDFAEIQRRLRTQKVKQTQFWGAFNPIANFWGKEYFFPEEYHEIIPIGEVPAKTQNTLIHKSHYSRNPFVNAAEVRMKNQDLALLDENNWIVYEEGNWGKINTGGEFYHQFKRRVHVKPQEYRPELANHLSLDFNVLPYMTLIMAQLERSYEEIDGKRYMVWTARVNREYCLREPENTTEACLRSWEDDYGKQGPDVLYYGDAMGNKRHEGTGNKTEFKLLRDKIARYIDTSSDRTWRANPSVRQSRNFINKILAGVEVAPGVIIRLEIDPSCKELINDLENCKLAADGGKLKIKVKDKKTGQTYEKLNHASDALSYLLCKAFEDYFKLASV